jgi:hypothetical protein
LGREAAIRSLPCRATSLSPSTHLTRHSASDRLTPNDAVGPDRVRRYDPRSTSPARTKITPESVSRTREGQPHKLRRRLAGDLDNIVLMAMRKEPHLRYPSVEQLSEDINRHLTGLPVIARKSTARYTTAKFVRRHRAVVAMTTVTAPRFCLSAASPGRLTRPRWRRQNGPAPSGGSNDVRRLANSLLFELHTVSRSCRTRRPCAS